MSAVGESSALALSIDGHHATITGVTFTWGQRCWRCRKVSWASAGAGVIRIGLAGTGSRLRWYHQETAPKRPAFPASCPGCGNADHVFANRGTSGWDLGPTSEHRLTGGLLEQARTAIRAAYAAETGIADEAMRAGRHDYQGPSRAAGPAGRRAAR